MRTYVLLVVGTVIGLGLYFGVLAPHPPTPGTTGSGVSSVTAPRSSTAAPTLTAPTTPPAMASDSPAQITLIKAWAAQRHLTWAQATIWVNGLVRFYEQVGGYSARMSLTLTLSTFNETVNGNGSYDSLGSSLLAAALDYAHPGMTCAQEYHYATAPLDLATYAAALELLTDYARTGNFVYDGGIARLQEATTGWLVYAPPPGSSFVAQANAALAGLRFQRGLAQTSPTTLAAWFGLSPVVAGDALQQPLPALPSCG